MNQEEQFSQIINKIQELKKGKNPLDLSSKEDLAIGVMNLISLEEHFFFTYNKTNDGKYLELLNQIRSMRKDLLKEIVKNPKGEIWCVSKHLLAASMRLMEVGTKKLSDGDKSKAEELFKKSYTLWNIFWGLNLGLIEIKDIGGKDDDPEKKESIELNDDFEQSEKKGSERSEGSYFEQSEKKGSERSEGSYFEQSEKKGSERSEGSYKEIKKEFSVWSKLGKMIQEVLDCCKE